MFESRTEKGLFTFYWEQYEAPHSQPAPQEKYLEYTINNSLANNTPQLIEENKRQPPERRNQAKHLTQKIGDYAKSKYKQKQNKSPGQLCNTLDLSPNFSQELAEKAFKYILDRDKIAIKSPKKNIELPTLLKNQTDRNKGSPKTPRKNVVDKLLQGQQSCEPIKLNLELSESKQIIKEEPKTKSKRLKKTVKNDKNINKGKQTDRNHLKLSSKYLFSPKQQSTYRFPMLSPPAKKKKPQQAYLLQKIMIDRQQMHRNSSVINLGIDNNEQYKARWQKRKNQFLNILCRNMSCNLKQS